MSRLRRALVFGASGQIGQSLLPLLRAQGVEVVAISRQPHPHVDAEGVQWRHGDLYAGGEELQVACDAIFSLGPLDAFAQWQQHAGVVASRVVAFGSTSVLTKSASPDAIERGLAQRLRSAEDALFAFGAHHGVAITLLRPTLIYGHGRDSALSRIVAIARRWRLFALPRSADGLRQPVHADDLASAALACARSDQTAGRIYALPGGETLSYRDMIARTLAMLQPRPRLLRLPDPLFRIAVATARQFDLIGGIGDGMLDRLDADLVFDAGEARRDFGYSPRRFEPQAAMFISSPAPR
jgi:nucleoside-diphosphate-sugar epimerase